MSGNQVGELLSPSVAITSLKDKPSVPEAQIHAAKLELAKAALAGSAVAFQRLGAGVTVADGGASLAANVEAEAQPLADVSLLGCVRLQAQATPPITELPTASAEALAVPAAEAPEALAVSAPEAPAAVTNDFNDACQQLPTASAAALAVPAPEAPEALTVPASGAPEAVTNDACQQLPTAPAEVAVQKVLSESPTSLPTLQHSVDTTPLKNSVLTQYRRQLALQWHQWQQCHQIQR